MFAPTATPPCSCACLRINLSFVAYVLATTLEPQRLPIEIVSSESDSNFFAAAGGMASSLAGSDALKADVLALRDPLQNQRVGLESETAARQNQRASETGGTYQKLEFGNWCGSLEAMLEG